MWKVKASNTSIMEVGAYQPGAQLGEGARKVQAPLLRLKAMMAMLKNAKKNVSKQYQSSVAQTYRYLRVLRCLLPG